MSCIAKAFSLVWSSKWGIDTLGKRHAAIPEAGIQPIDAGVISGRDRREAVSGAYRLWRVRMQTTALSGEQALVRLDNWLCNVRLKP
jgi:hypothetical protein